MFELVFLGIRLLLGYFSLSAGYIKVYSQVREKSLFFEKIGLCPGMAFSYLVGSAEVIIGILFVFDVALEAASIALGILLVGAIIVKCYDEYALKSNLAYYFFFFLLCLAIYAKELCFPNF